MCSVARRILNDQRRVLVRYLLQQQGVTGDTITTASTIQAQYRSRSGLRNSGVYTGAPEGQRQALPAAGTPIDARIPATAQRTLANGLRVIVAPNRALPLISADLRVGWVARLILMIARALRG